MKSAITLLLVNLGLAAHATSENTLTLHCDESQSLNSCMVLATQAVKNIGCTVDERATQCQFGYDEDGKNPSPYCELKSANCAQPMVGNFGGEYCYEREKVEMDKADGVHNGYWFGLFGDYSRTICRDR